MNKVKTFVLTATLVLSPVVIFAQNSENPADKEMMGGMPEGMGKGMMGEGMGKAMMGKPGMMMKMGAMMHKDVVPTSDGGVVVVAGNTLTKYDKSLNLIKEVQLKNDMHMQKMMSEMMEKCPMMGSNKDDQGAAAKTAETDHASHH